MPFSMSPPPLTIGVVTHQRANLLASLLAKLTLAIEHYPGECQVIVANNSGELFNVQVEAVIDASNIRQVASATVIASSCNNISVGRNLILDHATDDLVVFIDDDEYPSLEWLSHLTQQMNVSDCAIVAGPIIPVFPTGTKPWISCVDIHNIGTLQSGDTVAHVATGNCLINTLKINYLRFDESYGISGGEDTLFFTKLAEYGEFICWSTQATVFETIPESRSTSRYMINRFIQQGQTFRKIVISNNSVPVQIYLLGKACGYALFGIVVGTLIMPFNGKLCAWLLKRGYTNLGKLTWSRSSLYG